MEKGKEIYETPDIGLAAYLKTAGVKLAEIGREGDTQRYKFLFEISRADADKLKMDFVNSEFYRFDSNMKSLRIMIKSAYKKARGE